MRRRRLTLRARLTLSAAAGAAVGLAALITAFNLALDARLRADADNVLRERAAAVLRGLGAVDGRLKVLEAPDVGAVDAQTWILAGGSPLEQPAHVTARDQAAVAALAATGGGLRTVDATDTRLLAVPIRRGPLRIGTVVVAGSLAPYENTASSALLGSVILGTAMLAGTIVLSLWLISRALRPVAQMTAKAADWGEHDLSRRFFAGEPRDELSRLGSVFDLLLGRLAESLRREQQLTAEVSHELRTPLSKIQAEAELAAARPREADEYRQSLEVIGGHARDLERLLATLLASARAGTGYGGSGGDACEAAARAADDVRVTLASQHKSIEVLCAAPSQVAVDGSVVQRILTPLLQNAARFARRRVVLEVGTSQGYVVFEVRDDGPGVDPSDRQRIFDPGYRASSGGPDGHAGSGLGLALVRRLTQAAGGDVEVRPSAEGACFAVRLPAA